LNSDITSPMTSLRCDFIFAFRFGMALPLQVVRGIT
jgi:hypothetical protein